MRRVLFAPLALAACAAAAQALPDFPALQQSQGIQSLASRNGGDASAYSALAAGGQGILYSPGRMDADACATASDPRCLAVQEVDRAASERPVIDPDPTGSLASFRNSVTGNAPSTVTLAGFSSSAGSCRPVTTDITTPAVTRTCEEQWVRIIGSTEERSCSIETVPVEMLTSTYACTESYVERFDAACRVPVVAQTRTINTWSCFEGRQDSQARSCTVSVSAPMKTYQVAACTRPVYRVSEKSCVRRLTVVPGASCTIGSVQSSSQTDYATLSDDAIPGMDTLTMSYTCADDGARHPTVKLSANGGAEVSIASDSFDAPVVAGGNTARFTGELSCDGATCLADVTLTVYSGTGSGRVRSGDIHRLFAFSRYQAGEDVDYWTEECTR